MSTIPSNGATPKEPKPYTVRVSPLFIYGSLLTSIIIAFAVGRASRIILIDAKLRDMAIMASGYPVLLQDAVVVGGSVAIDTSKGLPQPKLISGKEVPRTLYTAKNFDTAIGSSSASLYLERDPSGAPKDEKEEKSPASFCADENGEQQCSRGKEKSEPEASEFTVSANSGGASITNPAVEEEHLPAGQHLLVDMKNVDSAFLDSEIRLAEAMVSVVNESKLTLLSYHCHKLIPMGVSCVGVLLESHISFHTWPKEGVITLDLFTCGSGELIPVLPTLERLFAVPSSSPGDLPKIHWSHKLRGFGPASHSPLGDDLGKFVLEVTDFEMKKEVCYCYVFSRLSYACAIITVAEHVLMPNNGRNDTYECLSCAMDLYFTEYNKE